MNLLKNSLSLFWILLIAVAIRLGFSQVMPQVYLTPDSFEYYSIAENIFFQPTTTTIVNQFRTPIYPLFIITNSLLTNQPLTSIENPTFEIISSFIISAQTLSGIAACFFSWKIITKFVSHRFYQQLLMVLVILNPHLFIWERSLLTEGLASSLLIISFYLFMLVLDHISWKRLSVLTIVFLVAIFLRPAFLLIPFTSYAIIILKHKNLHSFQKVTTSASVILICLLFYLNLNLTNHNFVGISYVSSIDIMGRVLIHDIDVTSLAKNGDIFAERINQYKLLGLELSPWKLINHYDSTTYVDSQKFSQVQEFSSGVIKNHFREYITQSIKDLPLVITEPVPIIWAENQNTSRFEQIYVYLVVTFNYLKRVAVVLLPVSIIIFWFKTSGLVKYYFFGLGSFATIQILTSAFFLYAEHYRMMVPTEFFMISFVFGSLSKLNLNNYISLVKKYFTEARIELSRYFKPLIPTKAEDPS